MAIEDLVAERVAIEPYTQIIAWLGDGNLLPCPVLVHLSSGVRIGSCASMLAGKGCIVIRPRLA